MVARFNVRLDHAAVARMLRNGQFAGVIHQHAARVHEAAEAAMPLDDKGEPFPTRVDDYITDRTVSAVVIAHPAGLRVEAKHGVLIHAAAATGLEVRQEHDRI